MPIASSRNQPCWCRERSNSGSHSPAQDPSITSASCLPANGNGRCADRAFEGPATNVIDLFLHRLRQRHHLGGSLEEILFGELPLRQPRLGQRRYHGLLDLGAGPAFHVSSQAFQVKSAAFDVPASEVNL